MTGPDATLRPRIAAALTQLETTEGMRLLVAVESGSRAWGFASPDSDWDVRIIYVRPLDAYLRIVPPCEVLGRPITDDLDLSGWDIRKVLSLALRSNAVVLEWLGSPIVYRLDAGAHGALLRFALQAAHLPALCYHYDRLARRHWAQDTGGAARLKSLFYAIRPALALTWMRARQAPPPMDLDALMNGQVLAGGLSAAINRLREAKAGLKEAGTAPREPEVESFLSATLAVPVARPGVWFRAGLPQQADALFRELVLATR